jgi:hypothetical protein
MRLKSFNVFVKPSYKPGRLRRRRETCPAAYCGVRCRKFD